MEIVYPVNTNKRPLAITFLALLYLAVGLIGIVHHFPDLRVTPGFHWEDVWIEATELLAILCGVFLLLGTLARRRMDRAPRRPKRL